MCTIHKVSWLACDFLSFPVLSGTRMKVLRGRSKVMKLFENAREGTEGIDRR